MKNKREEEDRRHAARGYGRRDYVQRYCVLTCGRPIPPGKKDRACAECRKPYYLTNLVESLYAS